MSFDPEAAEMCFKNESVNQDEVCISDQMELVIWCVTIDDEIKQSYWRAEEFLAMKSFSLLHAA